MNHLSAYYLDKGKEEKPHHILGSYYVPEIELMALDGGHQRIFSHLPLPITTPILGEKWISEILNLTEIWAYKQMELGRRPCSMFHTMWLPPNNLFVDYLSPIVSVHLGCYNKIP